MDDLISKQQTIDGLRDYLAGKRCPDDGTLTCRLIENEVINKLPPIQPVNNSEIPNSSDVISKQDALDIYDDYNIAVENGEIEAYGRFRKQLAQLPPIQPVIVPCDYAKACNEATIDKLTSAVAHYDALEELRKHGYVLVDLREVTT